MRVEFKCRLPRCFSPSAGLLNRCSRSRALASGTMTLSWNNDPATATAPSGATQGRCTRAFAALNPTLRHSVCTMQTTTAAGPKWLLKSCATLDCNAPATTSRQHQVRNRPDAIRSKVAGAIWAAKASMEVDSLKVHEFNGGALHTQFEVMIWRTSRQLKHNKGHLMFNGYVICPCPNSYKI